MKPQKRTQKSQKKQQDTFTCHIPYKPNFLHFIVDVYSPIPFIFSSQFSFYHYPPTVSSLLLHLLHLIFDSLKHYYRACSCCSYVSINSLINFTFVRFMQKQKPMALPQNSRITEPDRPKKEESQTTETTIALSPGKHQPSLSPSSTEMDQSDKVELGQSSTTSICNMKKKSGSVVEISSRERLKRHRVEVAGRVWIPDMWGQEELLKDWIDCTKFDASLVSSSIMSARDAMVAQAAATAAAAPPPPRVLRVENSC